MFIQIQILNDGSPEVPTVDASNDIVSQNRLGVRVPVIGIIGGPGSGKGTQCEKLVKKYNFTHISTGDLMRDEVKRDTEVGKLASKVRI